MAQQANTTGNVTRQQVQQRGYQQVGRLWMENYRRVAERIYEFRRDHPDWAIVTEARVINSDVAVFRAEIRDEQGTVRSTGHKHVLAEGRENYVELAETGAVGRALHFLGYKTTDLEEE